MEDKFIELRILTGLIVSTDYIQQIRKSWNPKLLESVILKKMSGWCIEFYDKYNKAPNEEIKSIFKKQSRNLKDEEREDVEDILADLSDEYERAEKFNVKYLLDQTLEYFEERNLTEFAQDILDNLERGKVSKAKTTAVGYTSPVLISNSNLNLANSEEVKAAVQSAFKESGKPLFTYPKAMGRFLNNELVRGGFISFMGPEKRGKTYLKLDMAYRAARQGVNVAFFQAGDMNQDQQVMRLGSLLEWRSDKEEYCQAMYEPVRDCIKNQMNTCDLKEREGSGKLFDGATKDFFREKISIDDLIQEYKSNKNHKVCYNCSKFWTRNYGTPWIKKLERVSPLTEVEAYNSIVNLFSKRNLGFRISTHANNSLTVSEMDNILSMWEREENFIVDLIIVDYADILAPEISDAFRHQENDKWKNLRRLGQERKALMVTSTQADADSYSQNIIGLGNFTEDKRKYGHVTAMYGLNQDKDGREKDIGLMRLNKLVLREGKFSMRDYVTILQNLNRGQPCLASY